MKFLNVFTLILLIVGGLNWGLVGSAISAQCCVDANLFWTSPTRAGRGGDHLALGRDPRDNCSVLPRECGGCLAAGSLPRLGEFCGGPTSIWRRNRSKPMWQGAR